jgi:hypothetical protein
VFGVKYSDDISKGNDNVGQIPASQQGQPKITVEQFCKEPAKASLDVCQADRDARKDSLVAWVAGASGGAALIGGIVLLVTAPSKDDEKSSRIRLSPMLGPAQGAILSGAF